MAGPAVTPLASRTVLGSGSNVVPLHPSGADVDEAAEMFAPVGDERSLQAAWAGDRMNSRGMPSSTAAARERRRHVLLGLTGAAFVTLLLALTVGGSWIAVNVAIDAVLVGYVVLLVRFRQMANERRTKVQPIRPPVTEHSTINLQSAPDYLVRSGT